MDRVDVFKSRLRTKGQLTLPGEVRKLLSADEGDDLIFRVADNGQIVQMLFRVGEHEKKVEHSPRRDVMELIN